MQLASKCWTLSQGEIIQSLKMSCNTMFFVFSFIYGIIHVETLVFFEDACISKISFSEIDCRFKTEGLYGPRNGTRYTGIEKIKFDRLQNVVLNLTELENIKFIDVEQSSPYDTYQPCQHVQLHAGEKVLISFGANTPETCVCSFFFFLCSLSFLHSPCRRLSS